MKGSRPGRPDPGALLIQALIRFFPSGFRRDFSAALADAPLTVIGVLPPHFDFPAPGYEVYTQLRLDRDDPWERNNHYLEVIARLAPGTSLERARAEAELLAARATEEYPDFYPDAGLTVELRSYRESVVGDVKIALYILLGAVGIVLLTACVNVANLLLARGEARKRELAIRAAIGASSRRITRQLFTESFVLAALGGLGGLLVAVVSVRVLLGLAPSFVPRLDEIGIDPMVMGFAIFSALGTGLLFGLVPALQPWQRDIQKGLKEGDGRHGGPRSGRSIRRILVTAQVMLAVVLATGAGRSERGGGTR